MSKRIISPLPMLVYECFLVILGLTELMPKYIPFAGIVLIVLGGAILVKIKDRTDEIIQIHTINDLQAYALLATSLIIGVHTVLAKPLGYNFLIETLVPIGIGLAAMNMVNFATE